MILWSCITGCGDINFWTWAPLVFRAWTSGPILGFRWLLWSCGWALRLSCWRLFFCWGCVPRVRSCSTCWSCPSGCQLSSSPHRSCPIIRSCPPPLVSSLFCSWGGLRCCRSIALAARPGWTSHRRSWFLLRRYSFLLWWSCSFSSWEGRLWCSWSLACCCGALWKIIA